MSNSLGWVLLLLLIFFSFLFYYISHLSRRWMFSLLPFFPSPPPNFLFDLSEERCCGGWEGIELERRDEQTQENSSVWRLSCTFHCRHTGHSARRASNTKDTLKRAVQLLQQRLQSWNKNYHNTGLQYKTLWFMRRQQFLLSFWGFVFSHLYSICVKVMNMAAGKISFKVCTVLLLKLKSHV